MSRMFDISYGRSSSVFELSNCLVRRAVSVVRSAERSNAIFSALSTPTLIISYPYNFNTTRDDIRAGRSPLVPGTASMDLSDEHANYISSYPESLSKA